MGKTNWNKIFFSNVKYVLRMNNIKVSDFERDLGLYVGYISRRCSGEHENITLNVIVDIINALGVSFSDLVDPYRTSLSQKNTSLE